MRDFLAVLKNHPHWWPLFSTFLSGWFLVSLWNISCFRFQFHIINIMFHILWAYSVYTVNMDILEGCSFAISIYIILRILDTSVLHITSASVNIIFLRVGNLEQITGLWTNWMKELLHEKFPCVWFFLKHDVFMIF